MQWEGHVERREQTSETQQHTSANYIHVHDHKRRRLSPHEPARSLTKASEHGEGLVSGASTPVSSFERLDIDRTRRPPEDIGASRTGPHDEGTTSKLVCFGMLCDMKIRLVRGKTIVPPDARVNAQSGQITLYSTGEHAANLDDSLAVILKELNAQPALTLQTFIRYSTPGSGSHGHRRATPGVCAIIYGPYEYYDMLGNTLDHCNMYLQDPLGCDRNVEYHNPHRLVDLGEQIRMTSDFSDVHDVDLDSFTTPQDLLAGLESTEHLTEAPVPSMLRTMLYGHQKQALAFMQRRERGWMLYPPENNTDIWTVMKGCNLYRNNVTNVEALGRPVNFCGGILGDTMGLGKSLTCISLIASDLDTEAQRHERQSAMQAQCTLLVVKPSLVKTWQTQFEMHVKPDQLVIQLHHGSRKIEDSADLNATHVVITTYNTLVEERKKWVSCARGLYSRRWRRVILDEAHDIRDHRGVTCAAVCALDADRRWAITGTPIQNRLLDLASLFKFLRVYPYDDPASFQTLTNQLVKSLGQDGARQQLRYMIKCIMLRRSLATVPLPARRDLLCRLDFSTREAELYSRLKQYAKTGNAHSTDGDDLPVQLSALQMFTKLRLVCNLGVLCTERESLSTGSIEHSWDMQIAQELFAARIASGMAACKRCGFDVSISTAQVDNETIDLEAKPSIFPCGQILCSACISSTVVCSCVASHHNPISVSLFSDAEPEKTIVDGPLLELPTKIGAVLADLQVHVGSEKCIVLSFWTSTLDAIAQGLRDRNIPFIRYDGTVPPKKRADDLAAFISTSSIRVALLTISCGAVGLDLTVASRAYLMEPQWNPAVEQQALARVHRIGQTRPVTTIRYIMRDSLEEYVLKVQHTKQALSTSLISSSDTAPTVSSADFLKAIM